MQYHSMPCHSIKQMQMQMQMQCKCMQIWIYIDASPEQSILYHITLLYIPYVW